MSRPHPTDFNDLLIQSIEETISEVLGARVTNAFWYHYQAFLGRSIVRKLYKKAGVPLNYVPDRPLVDYVEELKQILAKGLKQL